MAINDLMAELIFINDRVGVLQGALKELSDPADIECAAVALERIENAAYEARLIVSEQDWVEDDFVGSDGDLDKANDGALGVAIHATFSASGTATDEVALEGDLESLLSRTLAMITDQFAPRQLASHEAYVYHEGSDEDDAYIGISIPMGRVLFEVDELSERSE
ncbi:hypothetical protein [Brachybacterium sp. J153]|uniref:hypothetical protein n=1 Tax=Brachybacterium sp. J153 TaxID=3116488 RepID=UPI002E7A85E5|nr:hypothetical protein [Brachybacterium sp. J153]MEE1618511.1 hypothetical protein [Brachybacterium sp. J153]